MSSGCGQAFAHSDPQTSVNRLLVEQDEAANSRDRIQAAANLLKASGVWQQGDTPTSQHLHMHGPDSLEDLRKVLALNADGEGTPSDEWVRPT
jgi:hypothetical protein